MGSVIAARDLSKGRDPYRLLIYTAPEQAPPDAFSVNKPLAEKLYPLRPAARTMRLEQCFRAILETLPSGAVIKDIDVMFHPDYRVDVLKILIEANKTKPFAIVWPGAYSDGRLIYSEETLPDYKVFEINDYDVCCVV